MLENVSCRVYQSLCTGYQSIVHFCRRVLAPVLLSTRLVLSCPVLSGLVLSCPVPSCPVLCDVLWVSAPAVERSDVWPVTGTVTGRHQAGYRYHPGQPASPSLQSVAGTAVRSQTDRTDRLHGETPGPHRTRQRCAGPACGRPSTSRSVPCRQSRCWSRCCPLCIAALFWYSGSHLVSRPPQTAAVLA